MTLQPWHLHAYTGLCDLARSWPAARAAAGRVTIAASDGLRSTVYGRTGTGGHSDGGILQAVEAGVDEWIRWQNTLERVADHVVQAWWLAHAGTSELRGRALASIARALPSCPPAYARDIAHELAAADRTARRSLNLEPDRLDLPGATCPVCETRLLQACTSSPYRAAWTVVCGAGCRTDGAPSIWRWTVVAAWSTTSSLAA